MRSQTATKAYNERITEAKTLLADLTAYIEENSDDENVNWGHVGSLGHVNG